jgi:hypothetical protein
LEFVDEPMVPYFDGVFPVFDHAINNGPGEVEETLFGGDLMANVEILLIHADHLPWLFGPTDDGGEPGFGGVITCDTHFHESTSVVDNEGGVLIH